MRKILQTIFLVVLVPYLDDWSYVRMFVSVICGCCMAALVYFFALPVELPLWPAVFIVFLSGLVGYLWEKRVSRKT